jgi:hypothetical protein
MVHCKVTSPIAYYGWSALLGESRFAISLLILPCFRKCAPFRFTWPMIQTKKLEWGSFYATIIWPHIG